ncbi:MAG: carbohydrate ABC transporter permease [Chloroflexi bacterium]|nr:carbohydrate ABC transporter permease [Chloroflexota bacterium]
MASQLWLQRRQASLLRHVLLVSVTVIVGLPFAWMLSTSLKALPDVFIFPPIWIPSPLHIENYRTAWDAAPFGRYLFNSLVTAAGIVGLQAVTATTAAYAFAVIRFRLREPIFLLFLAVLMIPPQVTLVPNFLTLTGLRWIDTYAALIVPFGASAFGIFLIRQAFLAVPVDLVEAARIDGASHLQILLRIMLPLAQATLFTFFLLTFTWRWNDYFWPLIVINSKDMRTLPVGLVILRSTEGNTQWHLIMAATLLVIAPIVVLFVMTQRQFVQGIARTGIRG